MGHIDKACVLATPSAPVQGAHKETLSTPLMLRRVGFTLLLACVVWLSLFCVLATDWTINAQYSYGWVVPILALASFWERWADRPAVNPVEAKRHSLALGIALLVCALPIRLMEEANPEWRLLLWVHAFWSSGLSLLLLHYAGGSSWLRHFSFAALFPLISVPLPVVIENGLIQRLTRMVSLLTAELANLTGIPALQHGNLIEVSTGMLGVEEACSGIRSLQSLLLVGLFLGEFYRMSGFRRMALVGFGFIVAILGNILRTYALVRVAAAEGPAASQAIHDTAANWALAGSLSLVFLFAYGLRSQKGGRASSPPNGGSVPAAWTLSIQSRPRALSTACSVLALCWLFAVGLGVEWWYRSHEIGTVQGVAWTVREPSDSLGFKAVEIPDRVRATLRYSKGQCMSWRDESANHWRAYHLRWEAGRNSAQLAKGHTPDICLTGAGGKLIQRLGNRVFDVGGISLPFDQYLFEFNGVALHVFYCLWEDQGSATHKAIVEDGTQESRLTAVMAGKRHVGQTVIEVALRGPESSDEAKALFAAELNRIIVQ